MSATPSISHRSRLRAVARRAMAEHGLLPDFSASALEQSVAAEAAPAGREPSIRDLRERLWASIDNDDSRDLDQLSVAEALPDGRILMFVAIADVAASIAAGSPADDHARINTTSVYTAAEIFPMLPERYSTDLTSLGQGQDRLAVVVAMTVDDQGAVVASEIYRAAVRNRAKLAYNAVAAWLDGQSPVPPPIAEVPGLDEQIRLQDRAAARLKGRRQQAGALRLDTSESRAVFDGERVVDLRSDAQNRAQALIEELMVAANGAASRFLEQQGCPSIRRTLKAPKRWSRIVNLAASLGSRLPATPDPKALEAFLIARHAADPDVFPDLSLAVVKLLGSGEYAVDRPGQPADGHFALAARDYTHSTAPNRRFPDLVTQRLLKATLAGQAAPYTLEELTALAAHCTRQEDNATKIERQVRKSAAALFLESRIGEQFTGVVTGASDKGTWVRTFSPVGVEGRVVRGFEGLDVGDRVRVALVHTDVERGFIDFAHIEKR